ncbi:MAG: hypothetical protein WB791_08750 [Waddliaceae bacterium]
MRKVPITLTFPENVLRDLYLYTARRERSKFVSDAVKEKLESQKKKLARDFREASQDKERNKEADLWDSLSGEGLDEENKY